MRIGIPREIKIHEGRVALIPAAMAELVRQGNEVFMETQAGVLSGYADQDYAQLGITILPDAKALFDSSQLIVKVKEPQPLELELLRADQILFSYLHLAAEPALLSGLVNIGLTAVAFETVEDEHHRLPLLAPMSDIAGRLSVQIGANLLYQHHSGKGVLLGGLPAADRGHVVILGAGNAGANAAVMAAAMGAQVTVFDRNRDKLTAMRALGANVTGLHPFADSIADAVRKADLLVGAVLITGQRAPHLVSGEMVAQMGAGSVIVDISVDQGGCIETTEPTNYENPTYLRDGVVHFGVTNMPGAVPRSASQALSASLYPYVLRLSQTDWQKHKDLAAGINVKEGKICYPGLERVLN